MEGHITEEWSNVIIIHFCLIVGVIIIIISIFLYTFISLTGMIIIIYCLIYHVDSIAVSIFEVILVQFCK